MSWFRVFLDIAVAYYRRSPEFAAGEMHNFGLLRIKEYAILRALSHYLGDRTRCYGRRLVYCIAYGQDGHIICIAEATLRVP
ncbi:Heterokaryon incompatibility protein 6, OR allele [Fusarium oxysporum f. sp. albedinis]|nr:Heterokaryon incompatibility protein 6, OR allele [Fusarium oxysporum f. sp. albedinis]